MRGLPPGVELRHVLPGDRAALDALVAVQHAVYPDDPLDVEVIEQFRAVLPWFFDVAALRDGRAVAWGTCMPRPMSPGSPTASGRLYVLAAERERGIGGAILGELARLAVERGKTEMRFSVLERDAPSCTFLERRGYAVVSRKQESELLLADSDVVAVDPPAGIRITTLAADPELVRGMYEIGLQAVADVPGEEAIDPPDFERWCAIELERADTPAEAQFVAVSDDGQVVGYALLALSLSQPDTGWHEMTATRRSQRGRGVAAALKRATVLYARERGLRRLRTENEERNGPMLAINRRMGYRPTPAWLSLRGPLAG